MKLIDIKNVEQLKKLINNDKMTFRMLHGGCHVHFCLSGNLEIIRFLHEEIKWDFTIRDNTGYNGLLAATNSGHKKIINYLITNNCVDMYSRHPEHGYAYDVAVKNKNKDLINYFDIAHNWSKSIKSFFEAENETQSREYISRRGLDKISVEAYIHAAYIGYPDTMKMIDDAVEFTRKIVDPDGDTDFHCAAYRGNIDVLNYLYKKGRNINCVNNNGDTPLMLACKKGQFNAVKTILRMDSELSETNENYHGVRIKTINKYGDNIYLLACESGNEELVKFLENKYDFSYRTCNKETNENGFFGCAYGGNTKLLDKFYKDCRNRRSFIESVNGNGYNIFLIACERNNIEMVKYLVEIYKIDISAVNSNDENGFMVACKEEAYNVIYYLKDLISQEILHGKNNNGNDAYVLAAENGHIGLLIALEHDFNWEIDKSIYTKMIKSMNKDVLKYLENHDKFSNILGDAKEEAYFNAIVNGNIQGMEYIENCSDCDINDLKKSPYLAACQAGYVSILVHLEKIPKNNIHAKNENGNDAFHNAAIYGKTNVMKHLIVNHGWNMYNVNNDGQDVYMLGIIYNHMNVLEYLDNNHEWNCENNTSHDVLKLAEDCGSKKMSEYVKLKIISRLFPTVAVEHNNRCHICKENFIKGDIFCRCDGNHILHTDCYVEYLQEYKKLDDYKCPYCYVNMNKTSFIHQ